MKKILVCIVSLVIMNGCTSMSFVGNRDEGFQNAPNMIIEEEIYSSDNFWKTMSVPVSFF